jgi:hypothetical protein
MKNVIILICVSIITSSTYSQVGIGTTTPDSSSMLDIVSTNKGILIPKVALTSLLDNTTIASPAHGLVVFSTGGVLSEGYYYWDNTLGTWIHINVKPTNGLENISNNNIGLGGTLIQDTDIATSGNLYSITDAYATYQAGNNGTNDVNYITKTTGVNTATVVGLLDLSAFSQDPDTVILGGIDFSGVPATNIIIYPTTGNLNLSAGNDLRINAVNDLGINAVNDISINAGNSWAGGVNANPGSIPAGIKKVDFTMNPYDAVPLIGFELKENQNYSTGFSALHDTRKYSSMHYGLLNATNEFQISSAVQVSDVDVKGLFKTDLVNDYFNQWLLDATGFRVQNKSVGGFNEFIIDNNGDVGIGTVTPAGKLDVHGSIFQSGVAVHPDYVFEKYYKNYSNLNENYTFIGLNEVEKFIKKNGHLPGVTSSKEVIEKGGVFIGNSMRQNLEKVEELFLYTIEQQKIIESLQATLELIEVNIESLQVSNELKNSEIEALKAYTKLLHEKIKP